ncbi:hypothetical protein [Evansella clarkii]|uniref:hypothetical protein n=1 Tax=Evansella clarkii TaxID=79879 RepID=UPI00147510DD|nr:hypothetical protein [Evansella clarkii]
MEWSIEKQMIHEKWAWYKLKGYNFDQILEALENDKEIDNELLNSILMESIKNKT